MTFANFEGRKVLANVPFQKHISFELFSAISFGLPDLSGQLLSYKLICRQQKISRMRLR